MCEFEVTATYCKCRDRFCRQKRAALGESFLTPAGHIYKIHTCFRTQRRTCLGMFRNTDPGRLLVACGMNPNSANSTQDCRRGARYVAAEKPKGRTDKVCGPCRRLCAYRSYQSWLLVEPAGGQRGNDLMFR